MDARLQLGSMQSSSQLIVEVSVHPTTGNPSVRISAGQGSRTLEQDERNALIGFLLAIPQDS